MYKRHWSVWTPTLVYWVHRAVHNSEGIWKDHVHTVAQMPLQRAGCQLAKMWELCWKTKFWKASPLLEPGRLNLLSPWLPLELLSPSSANTECDPLSSAFSHLLLLCKVVSNSQGCFSPSDMEGSNSKAQGWQQHDENLDCTLEFL